MVTGTPSSGDSGRPARQRACDSFALARADSASTRYIAFRRGSHAAMRASAAAATSTGERRPAA